MVLVSAVWCCVRGRGVGTAVEGTVSLTGLVVSVVAGINGATWLDGHVVSSI